MVVGVQVGAAGHGDVVRFSSEQAGRTPAAKGFCAQTLPGGHSGCGSSTREQMTGRQAVCPLLGNKARIPLTQCDN